MKAGFAHLVQRFPDDWNLNQFARCACIAGDAQQVHALFERMGKPLLGAWPAYTTLAACEIIGASASRSASNAH